MICSSNTVLFGWNHELGVTWLSALVPRDTAVLADRADAPSGVVSTDGNSILLSASPGYPRRFQLKCQRKAAVVGFEQLGKDEEDCRQWILV